MVLWDSNPSSFQSAGFLNKVSVPCPNTSFPDLLAYCAPGAIENYFSSAALGGCPETLEEAMEGIRGVTADQAAEAAETVTLHSTYFLKGASA